MLIFEHDGLTVPVSRITAVQYKGYIVEIFTAFISHRISFDDVDEAQRIYINLRDELAEL